MADKAHFISADQLIENSKNRDILRCTLSADIGLGGGIPLGCTVLIGSPPKTGKTTLILQYAADAQQRFGSKVFFFPIEGRLTSKVLSQVRGLKTDAEHFQVVLPEPIFDKKDKEKILGYKKWDAERWWTEIGETIINNPRSVIIVDSIANLSSGKEGSEGMGYQDRGGAQKLQAQFCRKYGETVIPNQVTLFLITQIQANTSGWGAPTQLKVGNQIKHQADIIIVGKKVDKWKPNSHGRILGHDFICSVEESALGPPHTQLIIPLKYGYGIDDLKDVFNQCLNWGIVEKSVSWYIFPFIDKKNKFVYTPYKEEDKDNYVKIQGEASARNWLMLHPDEANILKEKVSEVLFGDDTAEEDETDEDV